MSGVTPRVFCVLVECGKGDGQTPASQAEKILGLQVILLFQLRYSLRITRLYRRLLKICCGRIFTASGTRNRRTYCDAAVRPAAKTKTTPATLHGYLGGRSGDGVRRGGLEFAGTPDRCGTDGPCADSGKGETASNATGANVGQGIASQFF